jgi:hypothetical protein
VRNAFRRADWSRAHGDNAGEERWYSEARALATGVVLASW